MAESTADSSVYEQLDSYPWDSDQEFQGGLTAILGNDPPAEQASELTLRARCFYYQRLVTCIGCSILRITADNERRKFNTPVDFDAYKSYIQAKRQSQSQASSQPPVPQTTAFMSNPFPEPSSLPAWTALAATNPPPASTSEVPAGPKLSYQEIVDLIQSGKPIPGIKEIPDTVLAGQGTSSTQTRRAKPWEKDGSTNGNLELVAGAIKAGKFMDA
jgi:hypothetical protein